MSERLHILLVDDDEEDYFFLKQMIVGYKTGGREVQYQLDWVSNYNEAVIALSDCNYDLYLVDIRLGSHSGLDLLRDAAVHRCNVPVIMLTGHGNYEIDLAAMLLGAADYLEKGMLTAPLLDRSIRYAIERARNLAELQRQAQEIHALQKATSSLLHTLDLSRLMGQILDAALEAIPGGARGSIYILERPDSLADQLQGMIFSDPRIQHIKTPDDRSNPLTIVSKGQTLLIQDVQKETFLLSVLESKEESSSIRSIMIAPLVIMDDVFGAISISANQPYAFTYDDLGLLSSFAATASAAIHNAILYAETQNLATHDHLTGMYNRRTLFEQGQREMDRFHRLGQRLSVLLFDVDNFKQINDRHGHSAGDKVLVEITQRVSKVIRNVDILGRYGGDEFVVLLPEADLDTAREIADRIRVSISKSPIQTDTVPILVTISLGIAQASLETVEFGSLLHRADQALYRSKQAGRNRSSLAI